MNNESRTLWLSLGAGLFAVFLLYSYSQEKKSEYDKKYGTMKKVLVATRDINELETLDETMLRLEERPSDYIEPSAVDRLDSAIGMVTATPIKKGEQLLNTKLLIPGPETGIAMQISPNKRAVTIPVDEVRGVAKLIRPGDRVDIAAALDVGKGTASRREVGIIMQNITVLATGVSVWNSIPRVFEEDANGKNINQINLTGDTKYTSITVEVGQKEAQDLVYILATSPGNLFFILRNPTDQIVSRERLPSSTAETILNKPVVSLAPSVDSTSFAAPPPQILPQVQPTVPKNTNTPRRNPYKRL